METVKRNVLILTSDLGFGHRSAAIAIREALLIRYGEAYHPVIVNPMNHPKVPSFYRENPDIYDLWVQKLPELYTLTYKSVDAPLAKPVIENFDTAMLLEAMLDIIRKVKPVVIVVTRDNFLSTLAAIRQITRRRLPIVSVVTDLGTVHRLWFHRVSSVICVPSQRVYDMALSEKVPPRADSPDGHCRSPGHCPRDAQQGRAARAVWLAARDENGPRRRQQARPHGDRGGARAEPSARAAATGDLSRRR